jgi:hypothetical protein
MQNWYKACDAGSNQHFNIQFHRPTKEFIMRTNRFLLAAGVVLAMAFIFSCSSDNVGGKKETYYVETGMLSETAYDLVKDLDKPAEELVGYCHRYRVPNDKYTWVESGISRAELEKELETVPIKAAILRSLDKDGAVFGIFQADYEYIVFLYIEKE